ncbi:epoxide hydrolase N-terminal domain-containing protein [Burkholderia plantarii]|uniref:epoxide hydrolase N-terminal domain-containing protein n=1 Tax=Burkholderia plantarii TaxID=41899 RepID=UPI001FC8D818|nr:epoxide hydrolase N-terminal domain-containing protein [Burkholderia plantarii]
MLNDFGQFKTTIDGLDIHFLYVRSPEPDAIPWLMARGWPGSAITPATKCGTAFVRKAPPKK